MTSLPASSKLPIEHLATAFSNVTNSYKFCWFLSILEYITEHQIPIMPLNILLAKMIASVWYPINYFRLSFGKQDRLSQIALRIKTEHDLAIDAKKSQLVRSVVAYINTNSILAKDIVSLGRFVPYRFLRPFFASELRGTPDWKGDDLIVGLAEETFYDKSKLGLYHFIKHPEDGIEVQQDWFEYLQKHTYILTGFCLWHLLNYLQKNNPNVPNIANKLFEPEQRDLRQARAFWDIAFDQLGYIRCIYSDQVMQKRHFSLDHFLPWRFVTHDLLWNIIPVPLHVNSSKSDSLPNIDLYFNSFIQLQYKAMQVVANSPKKKLLEDYTLLFKQDAVAEIQAASFKQFRQILQETIVPQIHIAKNMGFTANWTYPKA